jgi:hypothetical protein
VGGSATIGLHNDQFSFATTTALGWFVSDKLAAGGQVQIVKNSTLSIASEADKIVLNM